MTTTTLNVPDISCGHCKESIEGALAGLDGVESVDVAIEARTVTLTYDDTSTDLDTVGDALTAIGYEVAGET